MRYAFVVLVMLVLVPLPLPGAAALGGFHYAGYDSTCGPATPADMVNLVDDRCPSASQFGWIGFGDCDEAGCLISLWHEASASHGWNASPAPLRVDAAFTIGTEQFAICAAEDTAAALSCEVEEHDSYVQVADSACVDVLLVTRAWGSHPLPSVAESRSKACRDGEDFRPAGQRGASTLFGTGTNECNWEGVPIFDWGYCGLSVSGRVAVDDCDETTCIVEHNGGAWANFVLNHLSVVRATFSVGDTDRTIGDARCVAVTTGDDGGCRLFFQARVPFAPGECLRFALDARLDQVDRARSNEVHDEVEFCRDADGKLSWPT